MTKSKINNTISYNDKLIINHQKNGNLFLCTYINDFIKTFRYYNSDNYIITISGLKNFIKEEDKDLIFLLEQLEENYFTIKFEGNDETINILDINCDNITKGVLDNFRYQVQDLTSIIELSSKTDISAIGIIIMKIVAQIISKLKILYKAIVLDLDETLWKGTLLEDGIDKIRENMGSEEGASFVEFMKFIKTLGNDLGLFITICSRNDSKMIETAFEALDENIFPLKNQVDYIIANNNDKSENIKIIANKLSILPRSIVFIDDNQIIRDEVKLKLKEVCVPEWDNHKQLVTQLITACIFERFELSLNSQQRRKQYKIIQTERTKNSLPKLFVKVIIDEHNAESIKLYSKTNQFKFSHNDHGFNEEVKSVYFELFKEDGESLGIASAITYINTDDAFHILNWAISCRFFEIGLEEFILNYFHKTAKTQNISINYIQTGDNQKVNELTAKYSNIFSNSDDKDILKIIFTIETLVNISDNTNLRAI
jgi:FkbH-like protein